MGIRRETEATTIQGRFKKRGNDEEREQTCNKRGDESGTTKDVQPQTKTLVECRQERDLVR